MFTGLVREVGKVRYLKRHSTGAVLSVSSEQEMEPGDSVAINGVCQTVSRLESRGFSCDVLQETLRATNFGTLKPGDRVNLERALLPGDPIGGHIVNGHVDGTGTVVKVTRKPYSVGIEVEKDLFKYLVPKASVAVDGISLTVGPETKDGYFEVYVIPHTWENTNISKAKPGRKVNIEIDILAKYVMEFTGKWNKDLFK